MAVVACSRARSKDSSVDSQYDYHAQERERALEFSRQQRRRRRWLVDLKT
jgi:hypothetical protein